MRVPWCGPKRCAAAGPPGPALNTGPIRRANSQNAKQKHSLLNPGQMSRSRTAIWLATLALITALAVIFDRSRWQFELLKLSKFQQGRSSKPPHASEIRRLFSGLRHSEHLHQSLSKMVDRLLNFHNLIHGISGHSLSENEVSVLPWPADAHLTATVAASGYQTARRNQGRRSSWKSKALEATTVRSNRKRVAKPTYLPAIL